MTIKAIETVYKGYRFRSRLEARWAVFFDELMIPWKYEHEGYDLDGLYYLPDFCVKTKSGKMQFVEVKPDKMMTEEETEKAKRLALKYDGSDVFVVMGDPMEHSMQLFSCSDKFVTTDRLMIAWDYKKGSFDYFDRLANGLAVNADMAIICLNRAIESEIKYRYEETRDHIKEAFEYCLRARNASRQSDLHPHPFAAEVARSARFEHGETPR